MTVKLLELCGIQSDVTVDQKLQVAERYLPKFVGFANPQSVLRILLGVYLALRTDSAMDIVAAYLSKLPQDALTEPHAMVLEACLKSQISLHLQKDTWKARDILDAVLPLMKDPHWVSNLDLSVRAEFYRSYVDLYTVTENVSEFCSSAVEYLSYAKLEDIPVRSRSHLASTLVRVSLSKQDSDLAALCRFELFRNPKAYLPEPLATLFELFVAEDLLKFRAFIASPQVKAAESALAANSSAIIRKLECVCLTSLVLRKTAASLSRHLTFQEIGDALHSTEVEQILIDACGNRFIACEVDELTKSVNVTWVRPRYLLPGLIETLAVTFSNLSASVARCKAAIEASNQRARNQQSVGA